MGSVVMMSTNLDHAEKEAGNQDQFLQNTQLWSKIPPSWALPDDPGEFVSNKYFVMVTF